ncbi:uncharacterized protein LOC135491971 [Lineus longissimus]|uniref:uncharacterized protein LOC135491971 n=1 Tax=Lineus longissimus TaxID=88925 RepID=UPI00315DF24F
MSLALHGNQSGYPDCFERTIDSYLKIWKNLIHQEISAVTIAVAGEMCNIYRRHARLDDLHRFLASGFFIGNEERFCTNEKFTRALVITRYRQHNFREVTKLLTSCRFTFELEKLVALWDEVHYQMYILEDPSRYLTPLQKFRLRKRYPPPTSICPTGERTSNSLPKAAKAILRQWLCDHTHNPYPTIRQKEDLAKLTQLEIHQIRTWFANTRRRLRAKLKKELGSLNVGKGSKLKILTGKVDEDDNDDEEADPSGADDVFQMDANQIKSLVGSILKVDSPTSSQEDVNASCSTGYGELPQRNQQMRHNPTITRAQAMQNLQYAPPVNMMPCRNDAPTMTIPYRNFQNPMLRPSSSLGAPAKPMSMASPVSCPMSIPNTNRFEFPETKYQAPMSSFSSSCLCQPTAPSRQFYHQEDLIQISSDEDDREYSNIRHSISSILTQQQQQQQHEQQQQQQFQQYQQYQQYQRVFGVPAPMSGMVQQSDPQQTAVGKRRFFSPPAPQRVVSSVQQAHPSSFMPCNRVIESYPRTQNCSYQQNQGTIFMQPTQTCIPNQHPAFASPRQPCWTPTSGGIYQPLQMSRTMYTSPVAVYHKFNTPSPILSANTLYSEPQYGYNQVMTPPWTPPDISQNVNNAMQISRAPQATMTKPTGIIHSDPVIRLEKPPTARNLFCTPREESPCKGRTIIANLVKKELDPVSIKLCAQADTSILDLSHPQDEPEAGTPESSQLVIDEKLHTPSTEPENNSSDVSKANDEGDRGNEADMSCRGDDEREVPTPEPVLAPLKPLNLGDAFDHTDHTDHAVENSPGDQMTSTHTHGAGSSIEKRSPYFQQPIDGAQGFGEKTSSIQQAGFVGTFQGRSTCSPEAHSAVDYLDEPLGFPPQREFHDDEPVGFYVQGREETKYESLQSLTNVKTSGYEEGTASTGLTVSPMLLTQLWETLRNNRNSTS